MADERTPFVWQGKSLNTIGELMDAMSAITEIADEGERQRTADTFMTEYRAANQHADENIGYLAGYFGHDDMIAALRLFQTSHPIFGGPAAADTMTPDKALALGKVLGEEMKARASS